MTMKQCFCSLGSDHPDCCVNRLKALDNTPLHKPSKTEPRKDIHGITKWPVGEEES